ncbi:hypothetical protein [Caldanaerobacter sp.]
MQRSIYRGIFSFFKGTWVIAFTFVLLIIAVIVLVVDYFLNSL